MAKGSLTVEVSFLMPIILMMIMSSILAVFYFHDKCILSGAAYETCVIESNTLRENEELSEEEIQNLFCERSKGKCILFSDANVKVQGRIGKEEVEVSVVAEKGKFFISVQKKAAVTDPEKHIRNVRRLEEMASGKKNYN